MEKGSAISMTPPIGADARNPVICALDAPTPDEALALAGKVAPHVGVLKIGMEAFYAGGPDVARRAAALGKPIFLDLKLHDISQTLCSAMKALLPLKPSMVTAHAACGMAALARLSKETAEGADRIGVPPPLLLGVTMLTSLSESDVAGIGYARPIGDQAAYMAEYCAEAGLGGVVCSPLEIETIKRAVPSLVLVVPGVRPGNGLAVVGDDQSRSLPPVDALRSGADYLVIGRPITRAADPAAAARRVLKEIRDAG
ncbi:MAG: orotidine-5'-phosphate decarboxylase [Rickettsiales bacterium]